MVATLLVGWPFACGGEVGVGEFAQTDLGPKDDAGSEGGGTGGGGSVPSNDASDAITGNGGAGECVERACLGKVYACGNCEDDDDDGLVDAEDPDCYGPCHNSEVWLHGMIPGQNKAPCRQDCYFDDNSGHEDDGCQWNHTCDPLSVAPNFPPEGAGCAYDSENTSCQAWQESQPDECQDLCAPIVPNGCDCFGCCVVPGAPTPIWLGSEVGGQPSCRLQDVDDPELCKPCTQVAPCLNPCDACELCIGKATVPEVCDGGEAGTDAQCSDGRQACGRPGQEPCPENHYCVTGCCALVEVR